MGSNAHSPIIIEILLVILKMKSTWKVHNHRLISYFKRLFEQDSGHLVQHDNNYYTIDHTIS